MNSVHWTAKAVSSTHRVYVYLLDMAERASGSNSTQQTIYLGKSSIFSTRRLAVELHDWA